jgi:hypothetical protein
MEDVYAAVYRKEGAMCHLRAQTVSKEELEQFLEVPPPELRKEGFVHPQTNVPVPLGYVVPGDGPVDQRRNGIYHWQCLNEVYGDGYYVFAIPDIQAHRARRWRCIFCGAKLVSGPASPNGLVLILQSMLWFAQSEPKLVWEVSQGLGLFCYSLSMQQHPPLSWVFLGVALLCQLICIGMAAWILILQRSLRQDFTPFDRGLSLAILLFEIGLGGWMLCSGLHLRFPS